MKTKNEDKTVFTIGHSTRPIDEFILILSHYQIKLLVDIRSLPGSRYAPQFNHENLKDSLNKAQLKYVHLQQLGGRRKTSPDSGNNAWRNKSFRGFADYMQTNEFTYGLKELITLAEKKRTAIMCAEAVPWRCHRSLVADALLIHGIEVINIFSETKSEIHRLTPFAKVNGNEITYPGELNSVKES